MPKEDFVPVLVGAVLILIVLMISFFGITPPPSRGIAATRTISLGENFSVTYTVGEEDITNLEGTVSKGLLSGRDEIIDFYVPNAEDASEGLISLNIRDSNYYGCLIINVNGKEVYKGFPKTGEILISFNGNILENRNTLEIIAESSGWKIWAPTVYIFDLSLSVNYLGKKTKSFVFDLTNLEIINMNRARLLIFGERDGTGNLIVKINDREIYNGLTNIYTDFPVDILIVGNNTIDLSAGVNTRYDISSAEIVFFFG